MKLFERVEYSEEQKCFHTCDIDDILDYPSETSFRLLGIVEREQAMEFTTLIFNYSDAEREIHATHSDMELLFGIYLTQKNDLKKFYNFIKEKNLKTLTTKI